MFKLYQHQGTWQESLSIFLFVKLIVEKNHQINIITDYPSFELRDTHTKSYNVWVNNRRPNVKTLQQWLQKNQETVRDFKANFNQTFKPKVELWSDRKKTVYYKEKLQAAFEFENYIAQLLAQQFGLNLDQYLTPEGQYNLGENRLGIEIKNDTLVQKYGNVYIEYGEKSSATKSKYVRSGILKSDNTKYFLIGDRTAFWIFKKTRLLEIFEEEVTQKKQGKTSKRGIQFKQIATSKGFVFPVKNAKQEAITIEELVREIKASE